MAEGEAIVSLTGVSKQFGGAHALRSVDLSIAHQTVHGLVGENGAGKSTLGKIIAGVHRPTAGELRIGGEVVEFRSPRDAIAHGVTIIEQEISLVRTRTVAENVFLGMEPTRFRLLRPRALRQRFDALCERAGFFVPGDELVGNLRIADQQKVEILRSLARDARVIVMDEPTAALSVKEVDQLHDVVRRLRDRGKTIIYVSHFLKDVLAVCDDVTVLRDGGLIQTGSTAGQTVESLVSAMLGRSMALTFPDKTYAPETAPVVLRVRGLTHGDVVRGVDIDVRAGEIVGLAGLVGCGRSEIAHAIFGADGPTTGEIELDGRPLGKPTPHRATQRGLALLPESRKDQGLMMIRPVRENMSLAHLNTVSPGGVVRRGQEDARIEELVRALGITAGRLNDPVSTLSGGNQQKALFAKWLYRKPRVLLVDEPTRGVDVGAKRAIYEILHDLAADGVGVLMISSELEELLGLAHRILVIRAGAVAAHFDGRTAQEEDIMHAAFGSTVGAVA